MPEISLNDVQLFLLAFFRIAGMMTFAPVFGGDTVPAQLKIAMAMVLSLIFFPLIPKAGIAADPHLGVYLTAVVSEMAVGMLIGFLASLVFTAVQIAGQLVDQEMGLGMANILDPITNQQVSIIAQFKLFLAIAVFLTLNGHYFIIDATYRSFRSVPLMGFVLTDKLAMHVSDTLVQDIFVMSIRMAAPAVATLLLVTVSMAFMARTVPEMNIFILGFALRILVGFALLIITIPAVRTLLESMFFRHERETMRLLEMMGGR